MTIRITPYLRDEAEKDDFPENPDTISEKVKNESSRLEPELAEL
jgi:hypothetical protein